MLGTTLQRATLSQALLEDSYTLLKLSLEYKSRANALLPIARLPREILLSVFSLVAEMQPPHLRIHPHDIDWSDFISEDSESIPLEGADNSQSLPPSLGWIVLSHVSRSWRSVCLTSPSLWAQNIGRLPKSTPTVIERTGDIMPLEICVREPRVDMRQAHAILSAIFGVVSSQRIQAIDCESCLGSDIRAITDEVCTRSLPLLKKLRLEFSDGKCIPFGPSAMLNSTSLTDLVLTGFYLPFMAHNITSLFIGLIEYVDGFSGVELLRVLSSCPLLRMGEFWEFELNDPDEIETSALHVTLNHLENLTFDMRNPGEVYDSMLSHLTLPPSVKLGLWPDEPEEDEDVALLASAIRLIWNYRPCTVLELDGSSSSVYFYSDIDEYELAEARMFIVRCGFPRLLPRLLPSLNLQPYLKDITILHVSAHEDTLDKTPYLHIFDMLPNVTHLHVLAGYQDPRTGDSSPTRLIVHALWNRRGPIPLPRLEEVVLSPDIDVASMDLQKDVLPSLIQRVEHGGAGLKRLDLECFECPGEYEPITLALGRFVDEIRWKGQAEADGEKR